MSRFSCGPVWNMITVGRNSGYQERAVNVLILNPFFYILRNFIRRRMLNSASTYSVESSIRSYNLMSPETIVATIIFIKKCSLCYYAANSIGKLNSGLRIVLKD